ncbi:MAG TPA: hypothetical protein VII01_03630 [Solirubrobacteraceae bacterium]|jgi:hypothetical protein
MTDFLDGLELQLVRAAGRGVSASAAPRAEGLAARGHVPRRRRRPRGLLILVPALIALALGGLALGGVIEIGKPAEPGFSSVQAGYGPLAPGTSHLLSLSTPDPRGGPGWGMRVFSTRRGVGCIQVGRLLEGRLGALGQDGAFNNDGRFHEVAPGSALRFFACSAVDGNGRIFNNVVVGDQPASGWSGFGSCVPATASHAEKSPERGVPVAICPQQDERNLYYGLLGPDAKSITYTSGSKRLTMPTVGPEGSYLLVTAAPSHQLFDFAAGGTSDVVPVDGPITEVHYRDGRTCHLTSRSWIGGASACTPSLKVPVGYRPVPTPTAAQVATPIRARVVRGARGEREVLVSFRSRVALSEYRSTYTLKLDESEPHGRATAEGRIKPATEILAGGTVTMRIGGRAPNGSVPPGSYRGSVTLVSATGPALFEGPGTVYLKVGSFAVRVP